MNWRRWAFDQNIQDRIRAENLQQIRVFYSKIKVILSVLKLLRQLGALIQQPYFSFARHLVQGILHLLRSQK